MSVRILSLLRDRSLVFFTFRRFSRCTGPSFSTSWRAGFVFSAVNWDKVTWFVPLELSDRIESRIGVCGEKQEGMMGVSASASAQRMEVLWRLA
ncbi:MAG: hypothetical protein DME19_15775, partial [Verrucomicrobia bacterium]